MRHVWSSRSDQRASAIVGSALALVVAATASACSGEDEGAGKGSGLSAGASGGAAGSGQLEVGGRAGVGGSAGSGGGAAPAALGCFSAPPFAACGDAVAPTLTVSELPPLLRGVVNGFLVAIPNQPGAIALLGGNADDLEPGDGPFASPQTLQTSPLAAAWQTSPIQKAFDQVDGVAALGDDLWVLASYPPRVSRCRFDASLVPTCDPSIPFEDHDHATNSFLALPSGACGYAAGALLLFDIESEVGPAVTDHPAHVYDIAQKTWAAIPRPGGPYRRGPKATVLSDGRVLFSGGLRLPGGDLAALDSTEIFDGRAFVPGPQLLSARHAHVTKALPDGRVLLVGGYGEGQIYPPAEIVDLVANTSTLVATDGPTTGQSFANAGASLGACTFLSAGGRNAAEKGFLDVFSMGASQLSRSAVELPVAPAYTHALTLADGTVVVAGGLLPESVGGQRSKRVFRIAP